MADHRHEDLLVRQLPMDIDSPLPRRLAHLIPPLAGAARAPDPPPFRPPPPLPAAAAETRVAFRGWSGAPRNWEQWVAKLRPRHEDLWRKVGILEAVLASTYRVRKDASTLFQLVSFWSGETNTFAFPWGEATVTLEDVSVLGGFAMDGVPVRAPLPPEWCGDEAALNEVRLGFNRSACKKAHHSAWMKRFFTDATVHAEMEHAAFLALWLARFLFTGHPETTMRQAVFPIAVRLARGDRVALAPAVLASVYRDLREVKAYLIALGTKGGTNVDGLPPLSVYAPLYILQLWAWERFPALRAGKESPAKDGEPRVAWWQDASKKLDPALARGAIESGKEFIWQPYGAGGFVQACKNHREWVRGADVTGNEEFRSLAHCLRTCELVGMDCIEQYLPHRVAMQFGLDQDIPGDVTRANLDWEVAWETYEIEGKNVAFFVPQSEPGVTARYAQWWKQQILPSNLDAGTADIVKELMGSKRKVKKTPAAVEAEAEKERKMKKARTFANDKKRRLEELYDAKLSDWLLAARNVSSGDGSCSGKRGSLPKSERTPEEAFLDVESMKDQILLVPKKMVASPVNLKNDKKMKLGKEDKGCSKTKPVLGTKENGVKMKGGKKADGDYLEKRTYWKEKKAVVLTEGSVVIKDVKGAEGGKIMQHTRELVGANSIDIIARPEDVKPPMPMDKEELRGHVGDDSAEDNASTDAFVVDKFSDALDRPEGTTPMLEEKEPNLAVHKPLDVTDKPQVGANEMLEEEKILHHAVRKSLDVTDRPEEGIAAMLEKERELDIAIDESVGVSGRPEVTTAMIEKDKREKDATKEVIAFEKMNQTEENMEIGEDADERKAASEEFRKTCGGVSGSAEAAEKIEEADGGVVNNGLKAVAVAEEVLVTDQINPNGVCIEMLDVEEGNILTAEVQSTKNGEIACGEVAEDQREVLQVEQTEGGESNGTANKDNEKPQEAPRIEKVVCGEDSNLMKKDNEEEPKEVCQGEEVEIAGGNSPTDKHMVESPWDVPEVEHVEGEERNKLTKNGTDRPEDVNEVEHAEEEQVKNLSQGYSEEKGQEVSEVEHTEEDQVKNLAGRDAEEMCEEVPEVKHSEVKEAKSLIEKDTKEQHKEVAEVGNAEAEGTKGSTEKNTDKTPEDVHEVEHSEVEAKGQRDKDTDEKPGEVPELEDPEVEGAKCLADNYMDEKPEEVPDIELAEVEETKGLTERGNKGELNEVPNVEHAEVEHATGLKEKDTDRPEEVVRVEQPVAEECQWLAKQDAEDNSNEVPQVGQAKLEGKAPTKEHIKEKPSADSKDLVKKDVEEPKEVHQVERNGGEEYNVLTEKDIEENIKEQAEERQGKALTEENIEDTRVEQVEEGKILTEIEIVENTEETTKVDGEENKKDTVQASNDSINGELLCSSVTEQSNEGEKKSNSDEGTMEKRCVEDVELSAAAMNVDSIKNCKAFDMPGVLAMEQKQDHVICKNQDKLILEDTGMLDCVLKSDVATMETYETQATEGIENQETLDMEEEQATEERQDHGITYENKEKRILEDANMVDCGESKTDPAFMDVNESESMEGMQKQEAGGMEEEVAIHERKDRGVKNENKEKRILDETNVLDTGALKSDAAVVEVNKAESTGGLPNQEVLNMEEHVIREKQDQRVAYKYEKRVLSDIDMVESDVESDDPKSDATIKVTTETLLTTQVGDRVGDERNSSKVEEETAAWVDNNTANGEASGTNQTVQKESKETFPSELAVKREADQEILDNKMEEVVSGREIDEASVQDQTSTKEAVITPTNKDDAKESAEDSTLSDGKYSSSPVNTHCQTIKAARPSIEEVRRIHNIRSICQSKAVKESEGNTPEPSNRMQIYNGGYYTRQAVLQPVLVCKDAKASSSDSTKACGRSRAPDLVMTSRLEETSRWRQEQCTLQMLEDVQAARVAEKTRIEMEIRILKAQIASMQRQVMHLD